MLTRGAVDRGGSDRGAVGRRVSVVRVLVAGGLAVVLWVAGAPARGDDGPVTVTGDNRRSVDITVRGEGQPPPAGAPRPGASPSARPQPRPPVAADAPEEWDDACHVQNARESILCLAGSGAQPAPPPNSPAALALVARSRLTLPLPTPSLRPVVRFADGTSGGFTGAPIWLWTDPAHWQPSGTPLRREARAGAVWAVVDAAPVRAVWRPGDGTVVVCRTAGTPLVDAREGPVGSPDCGHTYRRTSSAAPGGRFRVEVGVTWAVTWAGSDGSSGALAPLVVTGTLQYTVHEARAHLAKPSGVS